MSLARIWHWTCDACHLVVQRQDPGLPPGWIFVKSMKTTHRCQTCKADVPRDKQGHPEVVAYK